MKRFVMLLILVVATVCRADYLGSWTINDYISFTACTHRFSTGAAYAASAITYRIYEDNTNVEIVGDAAMTAFDSVTGLYLDRVQLLAATGFEKSKHYTILIQATVDTVPVISTHNFQIEAEVDTYNVRRQTPIATSDITGAVPTVAQIRTEMDTSSTQLAAILLDTDELQTELDPTAIAAALRDLALNGTLTLGTLGRIIYDTWLNISNF